MPERFAIRRCRAADLDRILAIENLSFGEDAYDRELFVEFFGKCGEFFLVAERNRKVCGYIVTCMRGRDAPSGAELVSVAVAPAERGKGAASALWTGTLRRLRRRRVPRISLMVKVTNQAAIEFYVKNGFTKVRVVRRYYEDGADAFLMAREV